jgi:hypothetical protein
VGLEPMTSPSTLRQRKEVPFELKLIGINYKNKKNKKINKNPDILPDKKQIFFQFGKALWLL